MIFDRIKKIDIEEMPFELVKKKEKEEIKELRPPFNYQTASEEYYQIQSILD